jgi:hypothetical protein
MGFDNDIKLAWAMDFIAHCELPIELQVCGLRTSLLNNGQFTMDD